MSQRLGQVEGVDGDEPAPLLQELPMSAAPGGGDDSPGYAPTTPPDEETVPLILPPQLPEPALAPIQELDPMDTAQPQPAAYSGTICAARSSSSLANLNCSPVANTTVGPYLNQ